MTLLHQASNTFHRILAADVSRRPGIADIPKRERSRKYRAAARKFKIVGRRQIDQFAWNLIEEAQQRMNLSAVGVRDGATIKFISGRTEHAVDCVYYLARKDLWHS